MTATAILPESPFAILPEHVSRLEAEGGFALLRSCLKDLVGADFCTAHASPSTSPDPRPTWLLHRDILHALNMPLVALFHRASTLASAALCSQSASDLELAFSGDARSAFLWLQCFFSEEDAWVRTMGCPACVVSETLSTESHIRLTIAASLLSTASVASPDASVTATPSPSSSNTSDFTAAHESQAVQPQLPPLPHIIPALRTAIEADPFWGPDFWSYLFSRANQLSAGIQALMASMADLESLVASPSPTRASSVATLPNQNNRLGNKTIAAGLRKEAAANMGARVKESKLAKRQMRLQKEEMELFRRCAAQCWGRALVPRDVRARVWGAAADASAGVDAEKRARSLTCP